MSEDFEQSIEKKVQQSLCVVMCRAPVQSSLHNQSDRPESALGSGDYIAFTSVRDTQGT